MWIIDAQDETPSKTGRNYWIEITDSQLKFQGHARDDIYPDAARVTFEVNAWAKRLSSSSLNFQLLPILVDRGVPPMVFATLLDQDLTARVGELEVAMDSGLALRKWNQEINPITEERARYGGIEMQGGLPLSRAETINWFTEVHPSLMSQYTFAKNFAAWFRAQNLSLLKGPAISSHQNLLSPPRKQDEHRTWTVHVCLHDRRSVSHPRRA